MMTIPLSFLDLAPVPEGISIASGIAQTVETARQAEQIGLNRYWLAEHHNMPGIASAATSVLLAHIGAKTDRIRIGSGGVMLPNHAPLMVAEQFGTLQALYGDRIDLGLGRAPGTDGATFRALRRQMQDADRFPQDVQELLFFLGGDSDTSPVQAFPGANSNVPVWILGSSLFGATLAAKLGLPYAFASHFAPRMMTQAIAAYREQFEPSAYLDKPYLMLAANLLIADDEATARYHFTSTQQSFVRLRRGSRGQMPKPIDSAGLIIHESRFTYPEYGLHRWLDLGAWWEGETGLPLPLGAILVRRDLPGELQWALNGAVRRSLEYAYAHPDASRAYIRQHALELSDEVIDAHIGLYVNPLSLDVGEEGERAVGELLRRAQAVGAAGPVGAPLFVQPPDGQGEAGVNFPT